MKTSDARSLPSAAQQALRLRAVRAVENGMSQSEASRVFAVSRTAVGLWVRRARKGGAQTLESRKRGRPPGTQLTPRQTQAAIRAIVGRCPDQLKLPFALWTRDAVQALLEKKFAIRVSVWTVGRYLRQWGMTPQKPLARAFEQDPVAVQRWIDEEYPAIARRAKAEKARIHWGDEMGMRSDHQSGRSWGLKGRTPVIPRTGQRFGCNMVSTVTNRGELAFMVFTGRFTGPVFLKFLKRLVRHRKRKKIFLIVDGLPVHRARAVKGWLETQSRFIEIFFLPAYSPQLNPDELLNQDVKTNAVGRSRPRNRDEMIATVRSYLWSTQKHPQIIRNYFRERHVRYAAA